MYLEFFHRNAYFPRKKFPKNFTIFLIWRIQNSDHEGSEIFVCYIDFFTFYLCCNMHLCIFQIDKWFLILFSAWSSRRSFSSGGLISWGLYKSQSQPLISRKYYCLKVLFYLYQNLKLYFNSHSFKNFRWTFFQLISNVFIISFS